MQTAPLLVDDTLYVGLRDRSLVALRLAPTASPGLDAAPAPGERRRQGRPPSPVAEAPSLALAEP